MRDEIQKKIKEEGTRFKVSLAGMKIVDKELPEIINLIQKVKSDLLGIDLDNNKITDKGAIILGEQLATFKNLRELSIQHNKIGKKGAISLFSLKNELTNLAILFHGNKIVNVSTMLEIERQASAIERPGLRF